MKGFGLILRRDLAIAGRMLILLAIAVGLVAYAMCHAYPDFVARMTINASRAPSFLRHLIESHQPKLSVEAFVGVTYWHPVVLALMTSWAVSRASRAVAGEIDRGTLGWLLAYPVGRIPFLLARAAVMLGGVAFLQLALFVGFQISLWALKTPNAGPMPYVWAGLGGFLFYGAIGTLALWASAASSRGAVPNMAGAAVAVGSILLASIGGFYPVLKGWSWLSLIHYYDAPVILRTGAWNLHDALVLTAVLLVGLAGAVWQFARRDLMI